jgi:hypothetical protein
MELGIFIGGLFGLVAGIIVLVAVLGTYDNTRKAAKELEKIRKLIETKS